jgi:chlorite dismutase
MKVHIGYLSEYTKKLSALKNELLDLQDKYEVTADIDEVEELSEVLEELRFVVDNLPLA